MGGQPAAVLVTLASACVLFLSFTAVSKWSSQQNIPFTTTGFCQSWADFRRGHAASHNDDVSTTATFLFHAAPFKGSPYFTPSFQVCLSSQWQSQGKQPNALAACRDTEAWRARLGRGGTHPACGTVVAAPRCPRSHTVKGLL